MWTQHRLRISGIKPASNNIENDIKLKYHLKLVWAFGYWITLVLSLKKDLCWTCPIGQEKIAQINHTIYYAYCHELAFSSLAKSTFIWLEVKIKNTTILKKLLAEDIKYRSSIIVQQARQLNLNGTQVTSLACAAVKFFFCGDHQQCTKLAGSSCAAMPENDWMLCSSLYRDAGVVHIDFKERERKEILEIFNMKLQSSALNATRCGYETQWIKAFNRDISKNLPRDAVFPENYISRALSTVYRYKGHNSVATELSKLGCLQTSMNTSNKC